jgi:hypothetical protein
VLDRRDARRRARCGQPSTRARKLSHMVARCFARCTANSAVRAWQGTRGEPSNVWLVPVGWRSGCASAAHKGLPCRGAHTQRKGKITWRGSQRERGRRYRGSSMQGGAKSGALGSCAQRRGVRAGPGKGERGRAGRRRSIVMRAPGRRKARRRSRCSKGQRRQARRRRRVRRQQCSPRGPWRRRGGASWPRARCRWTSARASRRRSAPPSRVRPWPAR